MYSAGPGWGCFLFTTVHCSPRVAGATAAGSFVTGSAINFMASHGNCCTSPCVGIGRMRCSVDHCCRWTSLGSIRWTNGGRRRCHRYPGRARPAATIGIDVVDALHTDSVPALDAAAARAPWLRGWSFHGGCCRGGVRGCYLVVDVTYQTAPATPCWPPPAFCGVDVHRAEPSAAMAAMYLSSASGPRRRNVRFLFYIPGLHR